MISPRWRKVMRDIWGNKARTILVVLSIAIGIFAVGMIAGARETTMTELNASWNSTNPGDMQIYTEPFDEELLYTIRHTPGVREADARQQVGARFQVVPGGSPGLISPDDTKWRNMSLYLYPDYRSIRVGKIWPESGAWPPPSREILIERASLGWVGANIGDMLLVEAGNGRRRELRIAGTVHDANQIQASWIGAAAGYVSPDTLDWFGLSRDFTELHVIADEANRSQSELKQLAQEVRSKVEKSGRTVYYTYLPPPGKHPAAESVEPIMLILGVLGILSLVLSGLLVVNTMQALLVQQVRQMGIMKAIGARNNQIMGIYFGMVLAFGVLSLAIAMPLANLGSRGLTQYMADLLNFEIKGSSTPPNVMALEVAVGLAVPLIAALQPIISAARITPHQAMSEFAVVSLPSKGTKDDSRRRVRLPLSRPTLLSLRNTFRRKGRLALTLATLILGGAIFIAVFSVRDSLLLTLDNMFQYADYDAILTFQKEHRIDQIEREALKVPGVVAAEGWRFDMGRRMRPDDTESDPLQVRGVPANSALIRPRLVEGRWLLPEDENAVVVNTMFLKDEPDIMVGSDLKMKVSGRETDWRVVGIVAGTPPLPLLHVNYPYLARLMGAVDRAGVAIAVTQQSDPAFQTAAAKMLEEHFKSVGMEVNNRQTSVDEYTQIAARFDVLIVLLLIMAVLLAVVGAIGLAGTMSLNVLERTREIGVMRAIGASDGSVFQIVVIEGLLIGLMSWAVGAMLAFPLGKLLSDAIGTITMRTTLDYVFSLNGAGMWLAIASILAMLASLWPARNASRVSVRDVLAYE